MASILSKNPNKKRKIKKYEHHTLSDLKPLGLQLLSSRAHINSLPLLLAFVSPSSPPHYVLESLLSLQSFFITVLPSLHSSSKPFAAATATADVQDDAELISRTWLRFKFNELVKSVIDVAVSSECDDALKEIVLDAIMEFDKVGNKARFHSAVHHRFLQVSYFTYISIGKLAKTFEAEYMSGERNVRINGDGGGHSRKGVEFIHFVQSILSSIPPVDNSS